MGQRRRRAFAPTSNTASHDYHGKSSSRVSIGMVLHHKNAMEILYDHHDVEFIRQAATTELNLAN